MTLIRVQFAKQDEVRFISHLDLMRTFSRVFRRAKAPVAFSQGFNPHYVVSMGPPLTLGITSTGEYMDIQLALEMSVEEFLGMLKPQMPRGLDLVKGEIVQDNVQALMAQIDIAVYLVRLKTILDKEGIERVLGEFLRQANIFIVREKKKEKKEVDLKPLIRDLKLIYAGSDPVLQMRLQTGSKGNARPEEVISALKAFAGFEEVPLTWMHRQGLYVEAKDRLLTPFEVARTRS